MISGSVPEAATWWRENVRRPVAQKPTFLFQASVREPPTSH